MKVLVVEDTTGEHVLISEVARLPQIRRLYNDLVRAFKNDGLTVYVGLCEVLPLLARRGACCFQS